MTIKDVPNGVHLCNMVEKYFENLAFI